MTKQWTGEEAQQLIADILEEYAEDDFKEACDSCEECGTVVMCAFHSVLSLLAGRTMTSAAFKRMSEAQS